MGLFKNLNNLAAQQQAAAAAAAQQYQQGVGMGGVMAGAAAVGAHHIAGDRQLGADDPAFADIEGVSLGLYAKVCKSIAANPGMDEPRVAQLAESCGVPAGRWPAIAEAWNARMAQHLQVRTAFGQLYVGV